MDRKGHQTDRINLNYISTGLYPGEAQHGAVTGQHAETQWYQTACRNTRVRSYTI